MTSAVRFCPVHGKRLQSLLVSDGFGILDRDDSVRIAEVERLGDGCN